MQDYVYIDGKKYKRGYTTGSTATGAAKAAVYMLKNQILIDKIEIDTPAGIKLNLKLEKFSFDKNEAIASIKKDGGDDIDATHNLEIFARASFNNENKINIDGGVGIGRVTKKGIGIPIGDAAINKTPKEMMLKEITSIIDGVGVDILIYIPNGDEIAKKTFNPRLGIEGGISIIGTTGIVEPMSEEAWKKSLSLELNMKKDIGYKNIILVPGNHGEKFVSNILHIDLKNVVRTSNFVGYMLKEAKRMGYEKILLIGHIGKFVKLAGGIFHTHSKVADCRMEILISHLALMGMNLKYLKEIKSCITTEATLDILKNQGYMSVFDKLCNESVDRINMHVNKEDMEFGVIMFNFDNEMIGKSDNALEIMEVFR